jgi:hypothetical protein
MRGQLIPYSTELLPDKPFRIFGAIHLIEPLAPCIGQQRIIIYCAAPKTPDKKNRALK